jgi:uncharacterized protein YydD (DUF2326 family)
LNRTAEERLADAPRIDVVEIEVQLSDHADISAALPVDRNQRLDRRRLSVFDLRLLVLPCTPARTV